MARTALIVDDHPSFRASARALLEAAGFDVLGEAVDGRGALEAISELRPDVVLLDIQLPDISGFDVCDAVERLQQQLPEIVLVSSRDGADYGELVTLSCACGFVPKDELSGDTLHALLS